MATITTSTAYAASASAISSGLDSLEAQVKSGTIKTVSVTDGAYDALYVTAAQMVTDADALKALTGTYSLHISGTTTSAQVAAIPAALLAKISGTIDISDKAANVQSSMTGLLAVATAGKLGLITFTDTTTPSLSLTCAQLVADAPVFLHFASAPSITVLDTAADVAKNIATLQALANGGLVTAINFSAEGQLSLTAKQAVSDLNAVALVGSTTVSDTGADVVANLDGLEAMASATTPLLTAITLTDKTPALTLTAEQLVADNGVLELISNTGLSISVADGLTVAQIAALPSNILGDVKSVNVTDTDTNVAADLNLGSSASVLAALKALGTIKLTPSSGKTAALTIDAGNIAGVAAVLAKVSGTYTLSATSGTTATAAEAAAIAATKLKLTGTLAVSDTAANVTTDLSSLLVLATAKTLGTITFTDSKPQTITLSVAQATADAAVLAKFTPKEAVVAVADTAANTAKAFDALETLVKAGLVSGITVTGSALLTLTAKQAAVTDIDAVALVGKTTVSDTGADVVANLDALEAMALAKTLTAITLTDKAPALTLTAKQLVNDIDALALISNSSLSISVADGLTVAQIAALPSNILADIKSVNVTDSDTNVSADLNSDSSVLAALKTLGTIKLTSSAATAAVTLDGANIAAVAAVLAKISSAYVLSAATGTYLSVADIKGLPSAVLAKATSGLPVSDTAADISAAIDSLQTIATAKHLSSLAVSDGVKNPLAITAAQLVADSAALSKLTGTWTVTPTGTVTAAQAIGLSSTVVGNLTAGSLVVQDAGSKITADLDKLETLAKGGSLGGISVPSSGTDIKVTATAAQVTSDADALNLLSGSSTTLAVTGTASGDTVNLSNIAVISSVTLGLNTATFTNSLTASEAALSGTADSVTLSATEKSTVNVTLSGGVTEIANFALGLDTLDLTLGSTIQSNLTAISVTMPDGTTPAVEIASSKDTLHGVLLVGYTGDPATLLAKDMTVAGGIATFN